MKLTGLFTSLLLSTTVLAWTNEEHEIFDIVESLQKAEGPDVTFYTFMNVTQAATQSDITKAYRKRSLELHPDKNAGNDLVAERYARLTIISKILRDEEKRSKYDHFHDNGVPKWKGTGYFYARYRPGFKSVVAILLFFSTFIHYIFLHGIRLQKVKALNNMKEQAISFATGGKAAVVGRNGKFDEKKLAMQTAAGPGLKELGLDESPYAKSQKLDVVIIGPEVYVVKDGKRTLIQDSMIANPSYIYENWISNLIRTTYQKLTGTLPPPPIRPAPSSTTTSTSNSESEDQVVSSSTRAGTGKTVEMKVKKPKGISKGVQGDAMVAGRRRAGAVRPKSAVNEL